MNMKKLLFAATLVAMLPLLFSCGKQNNGGENQFEEPRFIQYAGKLVPRGGEPAPAARIAPEATSQITFLEFTESGLFVIGRQLLGGLEFTSGTYTTKDGLTFTLSNGMTVTLSGTSGTVTVTISPSGETFKADFTRATTTNTAFRTWNIEKVRATVQGFGDPVTAQFDGCDLSQIKKFLNENGHKGDYLPDCKLLSITLTGANTVLFTFSDNVPDVGSCSLSGDNVNFSWTSNSRLFELENAKATINYMDGKCILKIDAGLKGSTTSGSVTFVMSPMD